MKPCFRRRKLGLAVMLGVLAAGSLWSRAPAEEPAADARRGERHQKFLEALYDRGYFDTALDYLEQMRTSPLCRTADRERIDYEAGLTLIRWALTLPSPTEREKLLDDAQTRFKKYLAEYSGHPLAFLAKVQLANLLTERGKIKIAQSQSPKTTPEQKKQLLAEARKLFTEARRVIGDLEKTATERVLQYQKLKIDPQDAPAVASQRDQARSEYLQVRLDAAQVLYELGRTYPSGSPKAEKYLNQAAARFNELYTKYVLDSPGGLYQAGFEARLREALAWKELGQYSKALRALNDLLDWPDEGDALRQIKLRAATDKLETLTRAEKYAAAMDFYEPAEKLLRGTESLRAEGLALKYAGGEAALAYARSIPEGDKERAKVRYDCCEQARRLFTFVAGHGGEHQSQARTKLRDPLLSDINEPSEAAPKDYFEARDRGKAAFDRLDLSEVKEDEAARLRRRAVRYFRLALEMKPADAPREDILLIHSLLAYLYFLDQQYYDAAAVGDFLARRYPGSAWAKQSAKIALAAYAELYNESTDEADKELFAGKLGATAEFITQHWPDSSAADDAWMMLVRIAILRREVEKALLYLEKIPADSPRRGRMELQTGQALWSAYLDAARKPEAERPPQTDLTALAEQAEKLLQAGVDRKRSDVEAGGELNYTLATSVLSLAQVFLDNNQPEKAVVWLTDPKLGPLTLCETNHPLGAEHPEFRRSVYQTALRAFVAAQDLARAEKVMEALERLGDGGEKLTQIYLALGKELEELLKRLQEQGKAEQAAAVRRGFDLFLTKITQRPAAELNFNALSWVAETFMGLGSSLDPQDGPPPAPAKEYYQKAAETYEKILQLCAADKKFAPGPTSATVIKIRLSRCLRRLGRFNRALDLLAEILKENRNVLDVQIEAAETYQAWGKVKPRYYNLAISGGKPVETPQGKTNLVWGWGTISRRLQFQPAYKNKFFEARYHLARCRLDLARTQTGSQRKKTLNQAVGDVAVVFSLYPQLGGPSWFNKFDALLKEIQTTAGLPVEGLKGLGK
ncbi:MAG: hypothetical protein JXB10_10085 [Pirellulales bacterium]|nr:hypothetical protein [Pirellulales bacterium]